MDAVNRYLILPRKYCDWIGGLRWSAEDDTIVDTDGKTFAFHEEVAVFLEGFYGRRQLIHFGHVVHLLDFFRHSPHQRIPALVQVITQVFAETGRSYRNAGTFAAVLCGDLPAAPELVSATEVCRRLLDPHQPIRWFVAPYNDTLSQAEVPPLEPEAFEALMARRLKAYDPEDLRCWLRRGRGPVKEATETLVRQVVPPSPRNLAEVVSGLLQRPRLSGAAPFVGQLVSALALPPRRLESQDLPVGGYADVTTRGRYDQLGDLLPSQFVLDDLEFVRRFAEHELLHFRREEPQTAVPEELIVLLDQGVRCWGDVRMVLSAAAAALTKLAERRRVRLLFAGTSSDGRLLDPLESSAELLAGLLEASDLTLNPGLALEGVLQQSSEAARDIVLLSHPRNLREEDVVAASRRTSPTGRLFAVSLDDQGCGQLSQFKHGATVKVRDFRVDLSVVKHRPDFIDARPEALARPWTGNVEPIGFPFLFGISDKIDPNLFDFDYAGEWLFTASTNGMIFAWSVDSRQMEVLPRGWHKDVPVTDLAVLAGVAGGLAVLGSTNTNNELLVVHYDFLHRECQVYALGTTKRQTQHVAYFREYHTLLINNGPSEKVALDLGTGKLFPPVPKPGETPSQALRRTHTGSRAKIVYSMDPVTVRAHGVVRRLSVFREHAPPPQTETPPFLQHNAKDGSLQVIGVVPPWRSFIPRANGMLIFRACGIHEARCSGKTLAVLTDNPTGPNWKLRLFQGPEGVPLAEFPMVNRGHGFVLSQDGRRLARQFDRYLVEVRDVLEGGPPLLETRKGGSHTRLDVHLGGNWLAFQAGNYRHNVRWTGANLTVEHGPNGLFSLMAQPAFRICIQASPKELAKAWPGDPHRFVSAAVGAVIALVDRYGQVAILDRDKNLVCMFFVFRNELAAWMPGNIRWGPAHLTGGPASAGAEMKIGKALADACRRHRERSAP